jgi:hypothetical protein
LIGRFGLGRKAGDYLIKVVVAIGEWFLEQVSEKVIGGALVTDTRRDVLVPVLVVHPKNIINILSRKP